MSTETSGSPNSEQIQYWNDTAGLKWVALQERLDAMLAPFAEQAISSSRILPGMNVLDIGCGCGATSLELARRVGPTGTVVGIDISAPMLASGRARPEARSLPQLSFIEADAQTHAFAPGSFDLLFSRFGVMFFASPRAAFGNLRFGLKPNGRVRFVCWQGMQENPWMTVPLMAAAAHIALPPPAAADAPGPFAFADRDRVTGILTGAGFSSVSFENLRGELTLGGGGPLDETVSFIVEMGPLGAAMREPAAAGQRERVVPAVRSALEPYTHGDATRMSYAAWIVDAQA